MHNIICTNADMQMFMKTIRGEAEKRQKYFHKQVA